VAGGMVAGVTAGMAAGATAVVAQRDAAFGSALFAVYCTAAGVALLGAMAARGLPKRLARPPVAQPGGVPSAAAA